MTPQGAWNGCRPALARSSDELLDTRLVADRRKRVGRARRRFGRVLPARAVHLVELLGLRVIRLHLLVGDRPRGRDPAVMLELAEILLAQPVQRGAVALGRTADEVVHLGLERRAVRVVPRVRRDVAVVHEHVLAPASSVARAAAIHRARAAGSACPTAPDGEPASRRRRPEPITMTSYESLIRPSPRASRRR